MDVDERRPTYPLPQTILDQGRGKRARDFLAACKEFRDECIKFGNIADPGEPVVEVVPGNDDDFTDLDQAWNDFLVSSSQSPPDDDQRLAELLELAVEMVSDELDSTTPLAPIVMGLA